MKTIHNTAKIWEPVIILENDRDIIIGPNCRIGQFAFIAARKLLMDEGAEISPLVAIGGGGEVHLCRYSTVDYGAKLIPATFTTSGKYMNDAKLCDDPKDTDVLRGSITLKEGAVVGANAIVCVSKRCPDIIIGEFAVIGSGSYIDHSIESYTIVHPRKKFPSDYVVKKRVI
jgi:acetyltransferase-like isoleucine patch superfamily enzyme